MSGFVPCPQSTRLAACFIGCCDEVVRKFVFCPSVVQNIQWLPRYCRRPEGPYPYLKLNCMEKTAMSDKPVNESRRGAIKAMMGGLAAAPLMNLVGGMAAAEPGKQAEDLSVKDKKDMKGSELTNVVNETDEMAQSLLYKHDAKKSEREKIKPPKSGKPPKEQVCANCMFQQPVAKPDTKAEWVSCQLFPGKFVNSKGWCNSWMVRPGA